jgi:fructokinase
MLGAIEAGGTKFVCGVGTGPDDLIAATIPTETPEITLAAVAEFFTRHGPVEALGIGSFGPIDRAEGRIANTPKAAWRNCKIVGQLGARLQVPISFDTDVNAAALAEARWGAGRGLRDFVYLTVGTSIGGGAIVNGNLLHGLAHPEMGHLMVPHDRARDPFPGCCPYHLDCLEGLASGPALLARWGVPPEALPADHPAWELESRYLAAGLAALALTLSPERFVVGGGVMRQQCLFGLIRTELERIGAGYIRMGDVTPPELGERAGVLGALLLAETARA